MRKVFVIAWNSLVMAARDRKALITSLLMPLILIAILGAALQGMISGEKINPFTVLVVSEDTPAKPLLPRGAPPAAAEQLPTLHFGKILVDEVLGSAEVKKIVITAVVTDLNDARKQVAAGKAAAAIHVPANFTADAMAGRQAKVELFTDPGQPIQAGIVTQIVRAFSDGLTAQLLPARLQPANPFLDAQVADALRRAGEVAVSEVPSGARTVSAMQYYAAAMAIMFMLMASIQRAAKLIEEMEDGTLQRMLTSPTSRAVVLSGQVLGSVVIALSQFLILMIGTRLLFGVYWGPLLPAVLLGAAFALASAGIGTAVTGLVKDKKAADVASGVISNLFAALSGAMFPLYAFPDAMRNVARIIPSYWALQGFLDQMAGMGLERLWLPVAVLAAIAAATTGVGTWRLTAK